MYSTLRKVSQAFTFQLARRAPLSALLCQVVTIITLFFLMVAVVTMLATTVAQDVAGDTVAEIALQSQQIGAKVCVDADFRKPFEKSIYADIDKFVFEGTASDFLFWRFQPQEMSIKSCSKVVLR